MASDHAEYRYASQRKRAKRLLQLIAAVAVIAVLLPLAVLFWDATGNPAAFLAMVIIGALLALSFVLGFVLVAGPDLRRLYRDVF